MKFAFIGNYNVDYTTEEHRAKSFEQLGHEVIRLQENKITSQNILDLIGKIDALFYSHTHDPSYIIPNLIDVFAKYKEVGVPTVSIHLDRWMWLEREKDMGKEASWFTAYFFVADASPEAIKKYDELGVNWYYLKPGVYENECYMAEPDLVRFPHEIIFVGSKGYHKEYPERPALISFLERTYGDRFTTYGNDGRMVVRGHELNTLYASAKIAVGDSCFGGRPRYTSDRLTETIGRGGFLITPNTETLGIEGVVTYNQRNLEDLKSKIDYYLENSDQRERIRLIAHNDVKSNHTYTQRSEQIIDIIFNKNER